MEYNYVIGIDDTDAIGTKGTGAIASEIIEMIEEKQWGTCHQVTRHQLLIHPDIAYTSHNSAMIFTAQLDESKEEEMIRCVVEYLQKESAEGSDPGFCVLNRNRCIDVQKIIEFGYLAKNKVVTKSLAYQCAKEQEVYLSEHGGEGIGVIGALAGVGLRLSGNDGEMKGGIGRLKAGTTIQVEAVLEHPAVSAVLDVENKNPVDAKDVIYIGWKLKPILYMGEFVVMVTRAQEEGVWNALEKEAMREYGNNRADISICEFYKEDVVEELIYSETENCLNCIYRRWTKDAFTCEYKR